ncbi:uncharacterized protein DMAD_01289 [Drosophila madeirensis]|uniref:Uncharacterized protein n=1 Tax=Drosophila madeirensis TaxID=30013 RepID=A0AAU9G1V9_DROMD
MQLEDIDDMDSSSSSSSCSFSSSEAESDYKERKRRLSSRVVATTRAQTEEVQHAKRARYESELEFLSSQPMDQRQSTMLPSPARASPEDVAVDMDVEISQPDCNSSVGGPIRLTVRATVHHALDWSPTAERRSAHGRRADSNGDTVGQ